jgi:hypothetical protein
MNASSHSYNPISGGGYDPVSTLSKLSLIEPLLIISIFVVALIEIK